MNRVHYRAPHGAEENADAERRRRLEAELKDVRRREAQLVAVLEGARSAPEPVLARLAELGKRRAVIEGELKAAAPIPRLASKVIESRLVEWRRLLRGTVHQARAVLQRVLAGRLVFNVLPGGHLVEFEAPTRFSQLFAGVVTGPALTEQVPIPDYVRVGDERGHEAGESERKSLEVAYEQVLATAEARMEKVARPWRDSNPRSPP